MNQIRSGNGAAAAVLAGSLGAFGLLDVLNLLCRTRHVGELQVVGDGVEAHLWVDAGDLLDRPGSSADRLFELACLDDAWFTVTAAPPPERSPDEVNRVALAPLIEHVAPQVAQWHALVQALPFGAVARMAPAMPAAEVQIRSDQWRILSLIGAGRAVHEVVDVFDGRPLETLRLIHELAEQQLISIELPGADGPSNRRRGAAAKAHPASPTPAEPVTPATDEPTRLIPVVAAPGTTAGWRRGAAGVTVTAPDAAIEPALGAAPPTEPEATAAKGAGGPAGRTVASARPSSARTAQPDGAPARRSTKAAPVRAVFMPPPFAPGSWPPAHAGHARSDASDSPASMSEG